MRTKAKQKPDPTNMNQLHTLPEVDLNCEHTPTHECSCKPRVEADKAPAIISHNRMDNGPDKWIIRYVKGGVA